MCMWRPKENWKTSLRCYPLLSSLSLAWNSLVSPGWLASEPQGSHCLCFHSTGITEPACVLGIKFRPSWLCQLSCPPSPRCGSLNQMSFKVVLGVWLGGGLSVSLWSLGPGRLRVWESHGSVYTPFTHMHELCGHATSHTCTSFVDTPFTHVHGLCK